jgi:integral membrane protein
MSNPNNYGAKSTAAQATLAAQAPQIRTALRYYAVTSYVTGSFLLLLVVEMFIHYVLGYIVWGGGPAGAISFVTPSEDLTRLPASGLDLSKTVLQVHGVLYMFYLFGDFRLWTLMRWNFKRFVIIALGGIVPFLSFFTERHFAKVVRAELGDA